MSQKTLTGTKVGARWRSSIVHRSSSVLTQVVEKYGLLAILIAFTLTGLLYDFTVPFFEKPDELKHFAVIQTIQAQRRLPVVREGIYKPWDQEGTQPPLYHILAAVATAWLNLSDFEEPPRNPHYADDRSFVWRERGNNNLYLHPPGEAFSTEPVFLAARLTRWLSLLAGLGTVVLTYILARIIFSPPANAPTDQTGESEETRLTSDDSLFGICHPLPLFAAALVAFIPQFLHVSSAITNDSLSTTLAAAALVGLALVIKNGGSTRYAVVLGIILGLGAITKLSLLYLLPLSALVLSFDAFRRRAWPDLLKFGLIIAGLVLLIAGWWYWRNWQLYGDPTALNAHLLYRGGALDPRPTLAEIWQTELVGLELSFWAAFGAGQILLEPWLYTLLRSVKYLVLLGLLIGFWQVVRLRQEVQAFTEAKPSFHALRTTDHAPLDPPRFAALLVLLVWSLIIFIALLRWMQITPASWGRLLYPALPALGVLAAWSLSQFRFPSRTFHFVLRATSRASRPTSHASHSPTHHAPRTTPFAIPALVAAGTSVRYSLFALPLLLVAFLFTLALIAPFRYIQAAYAKTPLISEAGVPLNEIEPLDFTYDGVLRLIGYTIDQPTVQPGDWLPVTLYWQATQPVSKNYSAFVHLLDPEGQAIAQANTYPDGGNWPTSMLPPGRVLKDTYHIFVLPNTEAPLATRLALGIFEFDDPERAAKPAVNAIAEVIEPIVDGPLLLPHEWPQPEPQQELTANFGGKIQLTGYDWINEGTIKPGTRVPITFYWHTLEPPGQDLSLFIHLIDPVTQSQVTGFDGPPRFPTGSWQADYTIIDSRLLAFPVDLPPGEYELRIGWYNLDDFARLPLVDREGDSLRVTKLNVGL